MKTYISILALIIVAGGVGGYWYIQQTRPTVILQQGPGEDFLSIISPTHDDILEPGKPFTVSFTPVRGASQYEITITTPAYEEKTGNLLSADRVDTLLKATTTDSTYTITVPNSQSYYTEETNYNGEKIIVRALDKDGNLFNAVSEVTIHGKKVQNTRPAIDSKQIRILPLPNQPQLLDADTYVVENGGGVVTLKFGVLPASFKTRKVTIYCSAGVCAGENFTSGKAAFTKEITVKSNPFKERDTAFAVWVQYYDASGKEIDSQSVNSESFVSIKIKKSNL